MHGAVHVPVLLTALVPALEVIYELLGMCHIRGGSHGDSGTEESYARVHVVFSLLPCDLNPNPFMGLCSFGSLHS